MRNIISLCTGLFLCLALCAACSRAARQEQAPQPACQSRMQATRRKNRRDRLFQPARKRPQDLRRVGPLRQGLARRRKRSHHVRDRHRSIVGGTPVPAGSYTIFTVPNADKWQLVISKKTGEWGTAYPGPGEDLARIDMKVSKLPSPLENFTIAFDQSGAACTLRMDWETTRASVDIAPK